MRGPLRDVWKIGDVGPDRQYALWPRIQTDERLREHARWVWGPFDGAKKPDDEIARASSNRSATSQRSAPAAAKSCSCARRPRVSTTNTSYRPAAGEDLGAAAARDRRFGIHFEDYPEMRGLEVPEWSHLSGIRRCASPAPMSRSCSSAFRSWGSRVTSVHEQDVVTEREIPATRLPASAGWCWRSWSWRPRPGNGGCASSG